MLHTSDFDFELPQELIASHPLERRDASRMLVVGGASADTLCEPPRQLRCHPSIEGNQSEPGTVQVPLYGGVAGTAGVVRKLADYKTLPYNPKLKERARELRKAGSLPEALLWRELKNNQLNNLDFDRQKIIGNYIVDFYCPSAGLVIEIDDAATHDNKGEYDASRDEYLWSLGLTILRFSAKDVLKDIHSVVEYIKTICGEPPRQLRCHPSIEGNKSEPGTVQVPLRGGVAGTAGVVLSDKHIRDFLDYIRPGDVVVFNNSKVIPARFMAGGHEITLHTSTRDSKVWWGLCRKFTRLHVGATLPLENGGEIKIMDIDPESGIKVRFLDTENVFETLNEIGKMPLPPYMKREEQLDDRERYQTVYAEPMGSMAAPTAGLHFTPELLAEIEARGAKIVKVTLHVGAGTWMAVKTEDLSQHKMHSEWCCITAAQADTINNAKRVIAVGTTSMRTLESAAMDARNAGVNRRVVPICRATDIFITPGYKFGAVDVLLTNFHLPKSTLFMLVSAFAGVDEMRAAYQHAIDEKYRFFSYGDCCLLFKKGAKK